MPIVVDKPSRPSVDTTSECPLLPPRNPSHEDARNAVKDGQRAAETFQDLLTTGPLASMLPDLSDLGGLGPKSYGRAVPHVLASASANTTLVSDHTVASLASAWRTYQNAHSVLDAYLLPRIEVTAKQLASRTNTSFRDDLIQEARTGLSEVLHGFDVGRQDIKVATYGHWWIKERMTKWLHNNARTVRTPVWFNKMESKLKQGVADSDDPDAAHVLTSLASDAGLNSEFLPAIGRKTMSLDAPIEPGDDDSNPRLSALADLARAEPAKNAERQEQLQRITSRMEDAWSMLTPRENYVLRRYHCLDGTSTEPSYKEIGAELANIPDYRGRTGTGVTAERVRQIREAAITKLRTALGIDSSNLGTELSESSNLVISDIDLGRLLREG